MRIRQADLLLLFGKRALQQDLALEDVQIAYAVRLPDGDEGAARALRVLSGHGRRRPLTKKEVEGLLMELSPVRVYQGPEEVREALLSDEELKDAVARLEDLLEDTHQEARDVRVHR